MAWSDAARKAALEARRRHLQSKAVPAGSHGIGDLVKLHRPVLGKRYGIVQGWVIDPKKQGLGPAGPMPFLGAKATRTIISLRDTPLHRYEFGKEVKLPTRKFVSLKDVSAQQREINAYLHPTPAAGAARAVRNRTRKRK